MPARGASSAATTLTRTVVYEPGKCILCGACVAVAARAGDGLGLAIVGRGFDAAVAVPLKGTLIDALPTVARDVAAACPTGAFALKGDGGCCRSDTAVTANLVDRSELGDGV